MFLQLLLSSILSWKTVLLLLTIIFFIFRAKSFSKTRAFNKIPGPKYNFIFGNALQLQVKNEDKFTAMCNLLKQFPNSPLVRIWIGSSARLFAVKAASASVILGNTQSLLSKAHHYNFMQNWIGLGLLTSTGKKWHKNRKLITPAFSYRILEDFLAVFNEQACVLASILDKHAGKEPFNVSEYLSRCTLDIICETAMGKKVNAQTQANSEYVQAVSEESEIIGTRIITPWIHSEWAFNLSSMGKREKKILKILHGFTDKVIAEKRQLILEGEKNWKPNNEQKSLDVLGMKHRKAFLDVLLENNTNDSNGLTDENIREEVDTFMFEGHDTTGTALNWLFYSIGRLPDIQQKIHEELDAILGNSDRSITSEDLKQLKYLECVIKETLRLYPPVPIYSRKVTEETDICGYKIPADVTVSIHAYLIHRDPDIFPNPEKFDPDRFLPENCVRRHPYAFVPFSAGSRNCIGQKFAMMEEKVVIAEIMRRFKITLTQKHEDMKPLMNMILRPFNGVCIQLEHRNK